MHSAKLLQTWLIETEDKGNELLQPRSSVLRLRGLCLVEFVLGSNTSVSHWEVLLFHARIYILVENDIFSSQYFFSNEYL